MKIGVIQTMASVCRCGFAIKEGLEVLGHEVVVVDSESVEQRLQELAEGCDLIFDHTDTFWGRGICRALVRLMLEAWGARVVGSPARACILADDKAAAKAALAKAGVPSPPGAVLTPQCYSLPAWLRPPLVLKKSSEHMSRGTRVINSEEELAQHLHDLWGHDPGVPVLVEMLIPGTELAVPVVEGEGGPEVLPILEIQDAELGGILDEAYKKVEHHSERKDMVPAVLPRAVHREVELLACKAFQVLGLKDYARFDVRLSQDGTPFFLEANVTPSMEPFEAMALSARAAGISYPQLLSRIMSSAMRRYGGPLARRSQETKVLFPSGKLSLLTPQGLEVPRDSSLELAALLDVKKGDTTLDLGCGSGVLSLSMAIAGASRVVAVDIYDKALETCWVNAVKNGLTDIIDLRPGSWFDALSEAEKGCFDLIVSTPPQTPAPVPIGPKYGGADGLYHLRRVVERAPEFLRSDTGRLWLLAISLADLRTLFGSLEARFQEVEVVKRTKRFFEKEEYESLSSGLMDYLMSLRDKGIAQFWEDEDLGLYFENLFIRACRPRG